MKLSINHILPALLATATALEATISTSDDDKHRHVKSRQLFLGGFTDTFENVGNGVVDGANGLGNGIIDGAGGLGDALGGAIDGIDLGDALGGAIDGIDSVFGGLPGDTFGGSIDGIVDFVDFGGAIDGIEGTFNEAIDGLEGLYGGTEGWVSNTFNDALDGTGDFVDDLGDTFSNTFNDALDGTGDFVDGLGDTFSNTFNDALDGTEYFFDDLGDTFEDFGVMLYEEAKDIATDAILYMATLIFGEDKCFVKSGEIWEDAKESGLRDSFANYIGNCERIRDSEGRLKYSCDPASASEFEATCSSVGGMVEYKNFQFSCGGKNHSFLNFPGCVSKSCNSQTKINKIMNELTAAVSKDIPCEYTCVEQSVEIWKGAKESGLRDSFANYIGNCERIRDSQGRLEYSCNYDERASEFEATCSSVGGMVEYKDFQFSCGGKNHSFLNFPGCVSKKCNSQTKIDNFMDLLIDGVSEDFSCEYTCVEQSVEIWKGAKESGLRDSFANYIGNCERIRDSQGRLEYSCNYDERASEFEATCSSVGGMVEYKDFQFSCGGKNHSFLNFPGCVSKKCNSQTKIDNFMDLLIDGVSEDFSCEYTCVEQLKTLWSDKESDLVIAKKNAIADCSLAAGDDSLEYFCPKSTDFSSACSAAGGFIEYHNFSIECNSNRIDTIYYPDCVGTVCLESDIEEMRRLREQSFLKALSNKYQCKDVPDYDEGIPVFGPGLTVSAIDPDTKKQQKKQQLRGVASF